MKKYTNYILVIKKSRSKNCLYLYLKSKNIKKNILFGYIIKRNNKMFYFINYSKFKSMTFNKKIFLFSQNTIIKILLLIQNSLNILDL